MSIISNYIFKQIGSYFIYITIFFISLIWLILSLKFIEYVTANGLDFKDFIKMTSLLLPTVIPTLTPLTLSLACIFVYNRLSNDNELIIIKSSGFSTFKILKPAILLSLIIAIFIGIGDETKLESFNFQYFGGLLLPLIETFKYKEINISVNDVKKVKLSYENIVLNIASGMHLKSYSFKKYKKNKDEKNNENKPAKISFVTSNPDK